MALEPFLFFPCALTFCLPLIYLKGYQNGDSMETAPACGCTHCSLFHFPGKEMDFVMMFFYFSELIRLGRSREMMIELFILLKLSQILFSTSIIFEIT